ncbi:MAG TPA: DNA-formamidopyrimidine glycosylase family protein [Kofleriaceae bacterium]|nr:DNA-formamidopyrimidine glycosylase family protein [Kofleriaceae bacterium]
MPELPDITVYVERLAAHTVGKPLRALRIASPFLLRTYEPPVGELIGRPVVGVSRLGKRIVLGFEGDLYAVIHLMIAGRLRWKAAGAPIPKKVGLAAFDFDHGSVLFTEASPKKRASLYLVRGQAGLAEHDRGGLDLFEASTAELAAVLRSERHTIKRALTDPTLVDGVGNAYSDEILWEARMSPFRTTVTMTDDEIATLHAAAKRSLTTWIERLRAEVGDGFPDEVTAFRAEMAVHGKYGQPCPACGAPVQRVVYAANEANYCANCQTEGKLLADRSMSRLLKDDWPKTLEALEERRATRIAAAGKGTGTGTGTGKGTGTGTGKATGTGTGKATGTGKQPDPGPASVVGKKPARR